MGSHPLVAALLSALIPGAGQLYARRPLRALVFFLPLVVLTFGSIVLASRDVVEIAVLLVQPSFLSTMLIVNVLVFGWRVAAAVDAYVSTDSTHDRSWMPATLALVLLAVAVPHLIGWSYGVAAIGALETVFVAAPAGDQIVPLRMPLSPSMDALPDPALNPIPEQEDTRLAGNYVFRPGFGDPDAIAALGDILAPPKPGAPFLPYAERFGRDRLTVLLVGGDAGPGREGLRTDTMIVATFNFETGQTALFGLPRNFKLVPLPRKLRNAFISLEERVIEKDLTDEDADGYPDTWVDTDGDGVPEEPAFEPCHCFPTMLNKVHKYTRDWTTTYPNTPDPGLAALADVISHLIDLPIDYYVMVEMEGFVKTIDALGGVDVFVKNPYHVTVSSPEEGVAKATLNVKEGMNHLSGLESLAYVRWRIGSSDYNRMSRQRCLIRAVTTKAGTVKLLTAFPTLLGLMEESVVTDIPLTLLPEFVKFAAAADFDNVATVGFVPPTYNSGRTPGKYPIPNVDRIRWKVRDVLDNGVVAQSRTGESECAEREVTRSPHLARQKLPIELADETQ
jgi:LCP family protein required for cell wall assembly